MNDTFEDRLWDALRQEAERPESEVRTDHFRAPRAQRSVTSRRAAFGLAAAAVAGIGLAVMPGGGSSPAFAVEVHTNGDVLVTQREAGKAVSDPAELTALMSELRKAGINVIVNASVPYTCHPRGAREQTITMTRAPWHERKLSGVAYYGDIAASGSRPMGEHAITLHRGDTAWVESGPGYPSGRGYLIALMPSICTPEPSLT